MLLFAAAGRHSSRHLRADRPGRTGSRWRGRCAGTVRAARTRDDQRCLASGDHLPSWLARRHPGPPPVGSSAGLVHAGIHGPLGNGRLPARLHGGRRRWLHDPAAHASTLRRILLTVLPLALAANAAYVAVVEASSWIRPSWSWVLTMAVLPLAALSLASCYASGLALLVRRPLGHRVLAPLAAVGRTALTNYLVQSVICSTLMCSYGMGLYGHVRPPVAVGLTVLIFVVQVWFSNWWLRWFRFGPAEWVWRSATYRRLQPMRV
ncbi:MAG: DUF418 domain-containing protein [Phycisphaerales bacterium]|nr:MAG: DUF418 domain-containing protein [Phycisphaerales bacterium]